MLALTETPMPTPSMTVAPESVTPGFVGFAAVVILLVAVILLILDMNRRIRRVRYREEVREELDAEEAAARAADEATETDADLPIVREGDDDPERR
ncbi:hypothetical protein AUC47_03650 [Microbacterium sp. SZ1]|uniref:hypothetical protein n=1 Tax=Microbacterium sp. SZ1 TaxID=1849736 RepID=UPI000BD93EC7|nr:hypothetical protein [Microbacterium sp. SZ1]PCE14339.1 hypothetical protein AUC47_03650 [Microbacterium sp. SZ1]